MKKKGYTFSVIGSRIVIMRQQLPVAFCILQILVMALPAALKGLELEILSMNSVFFFPVVVITSMTW